MDSDPQEWTEAGMSRQPGKHNTGVTALLDYHIPTFSV